MATVSALATTLFLGGWHAPFWIDHLYAGFNEGYWPLLWFFGKVLGFVFVFIWLRGTLPRLRYDQFMALGWKWLIPISLGWIVAVATIRAISLEGGVDRQYLLMGIGLVLVLLVALSFWPASEAEDDDAETTAGVAGGFPTPPMPVGGAVRGAAQPLTFDTRSTTVPAGAPDEEGSA